MKLMELEPQLLKRINDKEYQEVDCLADADGIRFLCPKCLAELGGRPGVHSCICWCPSVPQTTYPRPGRWAFEGTGLSDLTLRAGSSSVSITDGCKAHFSICAGEIIMA